jgi:hypothetical protein
MPALTKLESAVIEKLLDGKHPVLAALRAQARGVTAESRMRSGVGFFTDLRVPADSPRAALPRGRVYVGDVEADILGLEHGAGFVLFIEDGYLATLEGYTYDEPWPRDEREFSLRYTAERGRDLSSLLR